ncbi:Glycoside hydrolase family 76 protein [Mycena venus]|uniref:Glycoside hydrolase family 76 protein n=1 Tax=Mycena venus TaxID=2733690 RepID=A0A8H6U3B3_9AGAR|nr:Glycoside hydrolase family 76 protein [Mycena venus]
MLPILSLVVGSYFLALCRGGQLASTSWRRPNITISLEDRINIAAAGIEMARSKLGPDAQFDGQSLGYAGQLYSQMAEFDIATNQTRYRDTLKEYFLKAPHRSSNFSDVFVSPFRWLSPLLLTLNCLSAGFCTDLSAYGHAGAIAYAAYKDQVFLDYAIQSWYFGQKYTLTAQQVAAGKTDIKNFTIASQCQDSNNYGGRHILCESLFSSIGFCSCVSGVQNNALDTDDIGTLATGLSALLAKATPDPMYHKAAIDSASFIKDHLLNGLDQVQDIISAQPGCPTNSLQESYNAGLVIEGLSILYSVTGDADTLALLNNIVNATIPNPAWQDSSGVLTNGDLYLPRGLITLYARNLTPKFQEDIGHYIAVQFNAITDLATANGTNIYGNSWAGPPNSTFDPFHQINALETLVSAISLRNNSDSSTLPAPSPTPTESGITPSLPQHSSNKTVIIGAILGTVASMGVAMGIWVIGRRRRRSKSASLGMSRVSPFGIWYNFRRRGKRSRDALGEAPAPVAGPRLAKNAPVPQRVPPVAPAQNSTPVQPPVNLPTAELVRMLNERLQGQDWDEEEAPPDYPV